MVHTELKLNMNILLDEFAPYEPIAYIEDVPELQLAKVRAYTPNSESLTEPEQTIYIASYSSLSSIDDNQHRLNVICPDRTQNDISEWDNLNLICLNSVLKIEELFSILQAIFEKYYLWHQRMLDIIMNSGSKQELLDIAGEMLNNPIFLFDNSIKPLTDPGYKLELFSGTIWEDVVKLGYSVIDNYTDEQKKSFFRKLNYNKKPFLYKFDESEQFTKLFVNLYIDKTRIGCLGLIDIKESFSPGQISLVNHIKNLVEAVISHDEKANYSIEHDSLIEKMLTGYYVEEKLIQFHLDKMHWRIKDSFLLLVFDNLVRDFPDSYKSYAFKIKQLFKYSIIIPFNENLVMILKANQNSAEQIKSNTDFDRFLNRLTLKCGISQEFNDFLDIKYYLRQAVSALREGKKKNNGDSCYYYKNYFLEDIVSALENKSYLQSFCHPQIQNLKQYDDDSGSEYIKTLYHYLLCGRKISEAAELLFIHRNTLKYRLSRIRELVDIDFDDNEEYLQIIISCRFAEFM